MVRYVIRRRPGEVRDAIVRYLTARGRAATVRQIEEAVGALAGGAAGSSVRSYLRLNTGKLFVREGRGLYALALPPIGELPSSVESTDRAIPEYCFGNTVLYADDCLSWFERQEPNCLHAILTDPPYGLVEYTDQEQQKLREGRGGVWRIPPAFDGHQRSPLPRFTVLSADQLRALEDFFTLWARAALRVLVPGANVVVASNPLLSHLVSGALSRAGLERRGEVIRLVMTMRGGDRPKHAHREFADVSVMPRSMWEPWLLFRKPIEGRVQDNLRRWRVGGFRRPSAERPFGDVIKSAPTHASERRLAPHPSLKPQAFLRQMVRAVLALGEGVVCDPFAGSGSTLAAAEAIGYRCVGIEKDPAYFALARTAVPRLAALQV